MISFETLNPDGKIPPAKMFCLETWQRDIISILEESGIDKVVIRYERDKDEKKM